MFTASTTTQNICDRVCKIFRQYVCIHQYSKDKDDRSISLTAALVTSSCHVTHHRQIRTEEIPTTVPKCRYHLLQCYTIIHLRRKINYNYAGEHKLQVYEATYVQQSGFTISTVN